jgi:AcrR family transcriptional regulator
MSKQPRKELLLDTAFRLVNEHGYHATGIDWILAESGVSKATLYKYFSSKEALILEVLQRRHKQLEERLRAALEASSKQQKGVLVVFDILTEWFNSKDFFGCNFIKASSEYPARKDEINQFANWHKESVRQLLLSSLASYKASQREALADAILMLMDGAIVAAQVRGDKQAAKKARTVAGTLLSAS